MGLLSFCFTTYQRDQIWRNFATLAKFYQSLAILKGLFSIWQNCESTLAIFYAITLHIITQQFIGKGQQLKEQPSGHTATYLPTSFTPSNPLTFAKNAVNLLHTKKRAWEAIKLRPINILNMVRTAQQLDLCSHEEKGCKKLN